VRLPIAHRGQTGNHPTAAVNLARLVATCARRPGTRVLNSADPGSPSAADIVRAIAAAHGAPVQIVGLDHDAPAEWGWTPWDSWPPFFLDTTASVSLGYRPVGSYAETVAPAVQSLGALSTEQQARLASDPFFEGRFDYAVDDRALRSRGQ
jgi:inactivated superfamily I helicase